MNNAHEIVKLVRRREQYRSMAKRGDITEAELVALVGELEQKIAAIRSQGELPLESAKPRK